METMVRSQKFSGSFSDKLVTFGTGKGLLGIGPRCPQSGDFSCVIPGVQTPFLLRENMDVESKRRMYWFVGECYVLGLMKGEGLSMGLEQDFVVL